MFKINLLKDWIVSFLSLWSHSCSMNICSHDILIPRGSWDFAPRRWVLYSRVSPLGCHGSKPSVLRRQNTKHRGSSWIQRLWWWWCFISYMLLFYLCQLAVALTKIQKIILKLGILFFTILYNTPLLFFVKIVGKLNFGMMILHD